MRSPVWIPCLLAACGSEGNPGTMTATVELGGEQVEFERPCTMPHRTDDYNFYARGGSPHLGFEAIWDKAVITEPGAYTVSLTGAFIVYVEHDDKISNGFGSVTFTTYQPEEDLVAGSFELAVADENPDDPSLIEASGDFECRN